MPPERLSALDASFLTVEGPSAHMHVGWAATFEPPADGPRPPFHTLFGHVAPAPRRPAPRLRHPVRAHRRPPRPRAALPPAPRAGPPRAQRAAVDRCGG